MTIPITYVELPATPPAADGPATANPATVAAGGELTVSGTGFGPSTPVQVVLYSSPVLLGQVQADATGAVNTTVTIPASTTNGEHTVVLFGQDPTGADFNLQATIKVTGGTTAALEPGRTGTDRGTARPPAARLPKTEPAIPGSPLSPDLSPCRPDWWWPCAVGGP